MSAIGARIANVPASEVARWKKALTAVQKSDVSEVWTVVLVSRTDALFGGPNGTLDSAVAERIMARVENIPTNVLSDLSASLGAAKADVALRIAENDRFFADGAVVRQPELDRAVAAVRAIRPAGTQAK